MTLKCDAILSTFQGLHDDDEGARLPGETSQTKKILEAYDQLSTGA